MKAITNKGYGRISVGGRKQAYAHRISYQAFRGDFDQKLDVLHHCDVRCCVNPSHLFLGTDADNVKDMMDKGRRKYQISYGDASDIRDKLSKGLSASELAQKYGISKSQIYRIKNGTRWRKLCPEFFA